MIFSLFFVCSIFAKEDTKKVFTINLNDVDSSKDLLKQIYEKADQLGFNFSSLSSIHKSEEYRNFLAAKGAQQSEKEAKQSEKGTKSSEKGAKSSEKGTQSAQNTPESPKKNTDKYPKTTAKQESPKSKTKAEKSSKPATQQSKMPRSSIAKSKSPKSSKSNASSKLSQSKSAKKSSLDSSKSISKDKQQSSFSKSRSEKSKISSMSRPGKSLDSSIKSGSRSIDKSSSIAMSKSGSSSYQDLSKSVRESASHSKTVSDFSQSFSSQVSSASASISSDVIDEIEKIKNTDQSTLDVQINKCEECSKVDGLLVYKDGNVWKDYSGKIEMKMVDGKLMDKTGVFIGKDCGCKKEEIPEIGKVTETGLYQDKGLSQSECEKQNKMIHHLANSSSVMSESAYIGGESSVSGSMDSYGGGASTLEGDSTSSIASTAGDISSTGDVSTASDISSTGDASTSSDIQSGSGDASTQSTTGDISSAGDVSTASDIQSGSGDASTQSAIGDVSSVGSAPTQSIGTGNNIQSPTSPQQPPVVFKAIKLKYDLACDEETKENKPSIAASNEKQVEYRTQTVTIIDEKKLPAETVFKTITRIVVPETVSKTLTQILKPEVVTITQKPDTIIRYSPPKTVTKTEKTSPVTITKVKAIEPEIDRTSEDMIDEPIQKVLKPSKRRSKPRQEEEEVVTVSKRIKSPYKGVECVPDCPCENEGTCDNPCMEIKCEIVE